MLSYRSVVAALLACWLVLGPVASAWGAYAATPCESMGSMSQPLPQGDCCGDKMDTAACLSACIAASPVAVASALEVQRLELAETAIPSFTFRYATVFAPPDITPPKAFVS